MVREGGRSALLALCLAVAVAGLTVASAQDLGCDAGNFTQGVANISNLQTSSQLLSNSLGFLGAPSNSTVFLPTDAAWAAFRTANGANAPDTNRSIAILLYNSIITYGQASATTLVAHSPVQTSAADLEAAYLDLIQGENVQPMLPLSFATANGVTTATDVGNYTASFNGTYNFCNQQVYATNGVLLPAASYAQISEKYLAYIAALSAPVAPAPAPALVAAPPPPSTTVPSTSANTPAPAPTTSPAASPTPAPAPAPAPSTSRRAAAVAGTVSAGIIAAGLLLAMV